MSKASKRLFSVSTTQPQDHTRQTEALIREIVADNTRLQMELKHMRLELVKMKEEREFGQAPLSPRSPSPDEEACPRGESTIGVPTQVWSLGGMMAQEVEGGRRRKVEVRGLIDHEKRRELRLPAAVQVGGVRWQTGIGGVQAGLMEAGVEFCVGARWLVPEGELQKRNERGSLSSTMVVRLRGRDVAGQLCRTGLWVGGVWCSVRRFVVVAPRWKGRAWQEAVDEVKEAVAGGEKSLASLMQDVRGEVRRLTAAVGVVHLGKNAGDGLSGLKREVEEVGRRVCVALEGLKAIGGDIDILGYMMAAIYKGMQEAEKDKARREKGKGKAGGAGVDFGRGSKVGPGFRF